MEQRVWQGNSVVNERGLERGRIRAVVGSWVVQAMIDGELHTIAYRPDRESAATVLSLFLTIQEAA